MTPGIRCLPLLALWGCSEAAVTKFNTPPSASITSHTDGDTVLEATTIELRGTVGDPNHALDELSVIWLIDERTVCTDSATDRAGLVTCSHRFEPGSSDVALEVRDPDGGSAVARVALTVQATEAPEVRITDPNADTRLYAGQVFAMQGMVHDAEDDPSQLTITWETDS